MSFKLTNNPALNPRAPAAPEGFSRADRQATAELARSQLLGLKQHVETRAEGSRFPGYLRIHNLGKSPEDAATPLVVKRSWGLREIFQPTRRMIDSTHYLRNAIITAYKDRLAPEAYDALMTRLDKYLARSEYTGFGSRHFTRFIREFENAADRYGRDGAIMPLDADTGRLLATRRIKAMGGPDLLTADVAKSANRMGVASLTENLPSAVTLLGTGSEGTAFKAERNGEPVVVKLNAGPQDLDTELKSGDVAACRVQSKMPHVAAPTAFIVEVRKDGEAKGPVYVVPSAELPGMVKAALTEGRGGERQVRLLGTEAPFAAGAPLATVMKQGPLTEGEALSLARGMALGMEELRANGLVHQDIKPDNVMLDRSTGEVRLIDVSAQTQLSRDAGGPLLTRSAVGSPPYQSPLARDRERGHGFEADRYSFAVTLLAGLAPRLDAQETVSKLPPYLQPTNPLARDAEGRQVPAAVIPPAGYLDAFLTALEQTDAAGADALRARIPAGSALRAIVEDAFLASQPGEAGNDAWVRVLERLGAGLSGAAAIEHGRALANAVIGPDRDTLAGRVREASSRENWPPALDLGAALDVPDNNGNKQATALRAQIQAAVQSRAKDRAVTRAEVDDIAAAVIDKFVARKKVCLEVIDAADLSAPARAALQRRALESEMSADEARVTSLVLGGPMSGALVDLARGKTDDAIRGLAGTLTHFTQHGLDGLANGGVLFGTLRIAHELAIPAGDARGPEAWRALMERAPLLAAFKQATEHFDPEDNPFFAGSGLSGPTLMGINKQMASFGMLLNSVLELIDESSPDGDAGALKAWRSLPVAPANSDVLREAAGLLGMNLDQLRAQV